MCIPNAVLYSFANRGLILEAIIFFYWIIDKVGFYYKLRLANIIPLINYLYLSNVLLVFIDNTQTAFKNTAKGILSNISFILLQSKFYST